MAEYWLSFVYVNNLCSYGQLSSLKTNAIQGQAAHIRTIETAGRKWGKNKPTALNS